MIEGDTSQPAAKRQQIGQWTGSRRVRCLRTTWAALSSAAAASTRNPIPRPDRGLAGHPGQLAGPDHADHRLTPPIPAVGGRPAAWPSAAAADSRWLVIARRRCTRGGRVAPAPGRGQPGCIGARGCRAARPGGSACGRNSANTAGPRPDQHDLAAVGRRDGPGQRKPEAGAVRRAADAALEDPRRQLLRHAAALVPDLDHDRPGGLRGPDRHRARAVHQRVVQQRRDHLGSAPGVAKANKPFSPATSSLRFSRRKAGSHSTTCWRDDLVDAGQGGARRARAGRGRAADRRPRPAARSGPAPPRLPRARHPGSRRPRSSPPAAWTAPSAGSSADATRRRRSRARRTAGR